MNKPFFLTNPNIIRKSKNVRIRIRLLFEILKKIRIYSNHQKRFDNSKIIQIIQLSLNIMWKIKSKKQDLRKHIKKIHKGKVPTYNGRIFRKKSEIPPNALFCRNLLGFLGLIPNLDSK